MIVFLPVTNTSGVVERIPADTSDTRRHWICAPRYRQVGHQTWQLLADAVYTDGHFIEMFRKGFRWNGNSTFGPLKLYLSPSDGLPGSLRHDSHYQFHCAFAWDVTACEWVRVKVSKAWSDAEFQRDAYMAGARITKTWAEWLGVHVGGWPAWLTHTCNGRHSPTACQADTWDWCPYKFPFPPLSDRNINEIGRTEE